MHALMTPGSPSPGNEFPATLAGRTLEGPMLSGAQLALMRGVVGAPLRRLALVTSVSHNNIVSAWEQYDAENPRPPSPAKVKYARFLTLAVVVDPAWAKQMLSLDPSRARELSSILAKRWAEVAPPDLVPYWVEEEAHAIQS